MTGIGSVCDRSVPVRLTLFFALLSSSGIVILEWVLAAHPTDEQVRVIMPILWLLITTPAFLHFARLLILQGPQAPAGANSSYLHGLEQLQDTILEGSIQGIFGLDVQGRVTFANPAMCRMLGYQERELVGRSHHETVHSRHPDGSPFPSDQCPVLTAVRAGRANRGEEHYQRRDGSFMPVEYTCNPVHEGGRLIGAVVFFLDISERKQAESRLRQAAAVFKHSQEGVMITKPDGTIVAVNPAFSAITGYPSDQVLGRGAHILKSGRHGARFFRQMRRTLQEQGHWRGEIWSRQRSGELFPSWVSIAAVRDEAGRTTHYVSVLTDIRELKDIQQRLDHMAHHDALTGLPNRVLFNDRLDQALKRARRDNYQVAILFLDLDRFKNINDSLGHPVGDELLKGVTRRIVDLLRERDTLARLSGDEFILLLDYLDEPGDAAVVALKLQEALNRPFNLRDMELAVSASIGISLFPRDGQDPATLVRNADAAMYRAKEQGRNNHCFYTDDLTKATAERIRLENDLRHALSRGELFLEYQPQVMLREGQLSGAEALLRWRHPELGLIPPGRFVPLAEDTGLILSIGKWVLTEACHQARAWLDTGLELSRMAVNVAGLQIRRPGLLEAVSQALQDSGLPPERLELEVTETFIMDDAEHALDVLQRLHELGIWLAIDDFGTGYSSLSYLKRLPLHRIKLDAGFVRDLPNNPDDCAIAGAVVALGQSLGLQVTAEGVETHVQRDYLIDLGCAEAQGYLFDRPLSAARFLNRYGRPQ